MLRIIFMIAVLMITGCASINDSEFGRDKSTTIKMRTLMLGVWRGEKNHDDGTYQKWLVTRFPDGTYRIDFSKVSPTGRKESWGEYGLWGIRNPIYFTAMRGFIENSNPTPADPTDSTFYDAYKVVLLTEQEFTYKSYTSGSTFTIKRQCSANKT